MRVVWTEPAIDSLRAIQDYISESNPINEERFISSIIDSTIHLLEIFPYSGRVIPEMNNPDFRELINKSYRVMYRIDDELIHILSVQNSCQLFRPLP